MIVEFEKNFKGFNVQVDSPDGINDRITSAIAMSLNKLVPKRETTVHGINAVVSPVICNLKNRNL